MRKTAGGHRETVGLSGEDLETAFLGRRPSSSKKSREENKRTGSKETARERKPTCSSEAERHPTQGYPLVEGGRVRNVLTKNERWVPKQVGFTVTKQLRKSSPVDQSFDNWGKGKTSVTGQERGKETNSRKMEDGRSSGKEKTVIWNRAG